MTISFKEIHKNTKMGPKPWWEGQEFLSSSLGWGGLGRQIFHTLYLKMLLSTFCNIEALQQSADCKLQSLFRASMVQMWLYALSIILSCASLFYLCLRFHNIPIMQQNAGHISMSNVISYVCTLSFQSLRIQFKNQSDTRITIESFSSKEYHIFCGGEYSIPDIPPSPKDCQNIIWLSKENDNYHTKMHAVKIIKQSIHFKEM